jgi:hypothetical protein
LGADGAGFVNEVPRCSTAGIPLSRWWYTAGLNLRYSAPAVLYLATPAKRGVPPPPPQRQHISCVISQVRPSQRASKWGCGLTAPPTPDDLPTTQRPKGHPEEGTTHRESMARAYCMRKAYGTIRESKSLKRPAFKEYPCVCIYTGRATVDTVACRWHRAHGYCGNRNGNRTISRISIGAESTEDQRATPIVK